MEAQSSQSTGLGHTAGWIQTSGPNSHSQTPCPTKTEVCSSPQSRCWGLRGRQGPSGHPQCRRGQPSPKQGKGMGWHRKKKPSLLCRGEAAPRHAAPTLGLRVCGLPAWVWWSEAMVDGAVQSDLEDMGKTSPQPPTPAPTLVPGCPAAWTPSWLEFACKPVPDGGKGLKTW
jgi:hypothetical protein